MIKNAEAMDWLAAFADQAAGSDQLRGRESRSALLATGLYGEAGSVLAELKKSAREGSAYPGYRLRLIEEFGDVLWYFVRLTSELDPALLARLPREAGPSGSQNGRPFESPIRFALAVADVLRCLETSSHAGTRANLEKCWNEILRLSTEAGVDLQRAAESNIAKTQSRWPAERRFASLPDDSYPLEERIPRTLTIEFHERRRGNRVEVLLRHEGITLGDRVTDNILDPDGYRYHDIFHFSHAVSLGWSPVTRALLRCKRKSRPAIDENEDGARAGALEEAISALVFSRAKMMRYFEGATQVDYDLLKSIHEMIQGYEVQSIPVWQWEHAILEGYRIFRLLTQHQGGIVKWDLRGHRLEWAPI